MIYQYYPGCSLEGTALEYNFATRAVMEAVGAQLHEIKDWTCCGASAAEATSLLLSLALPARNLALAEQADDVRDILVPCSACYLNLKKVEEKTHSDSGLREQLNGLLEQDGLQLAGTSRVRHIATVCPMCQMNLEAYQNQISRQQGRDLHLTIVYLPQLIGLAMQLPLPAVGLNLNLAVDGVFRSRQAI